jgi:HK97 family phage prohead protease
MPFPQEHACRLNSPGKYDRFARKNCAQKHEGKCIDAIFGIKEGKSEIQSLRYPKKIWTAAAARSHCSSREGSFEAAAEGEEAMYEMSVKTAEGKTEFKVVSSGELADWFKAHVDAEGNVTEEVGLFGTALLKAGTDDDTVSWVMSDFTLDRDKERIDPSGWDLKQYKKNPVVLWSHDVMRPAIGRVVSPRVSNGALRGKVQFVPKEIDEFGWQIGQKVKAGFLSAGSVGFRPIKVEMVDPETEPKEEARAIIRKAELFEFSVCNVPANPAAQPERPAEPGKSEEPNAETIEAMEATERGEVLKSTEDLFGELEELAAAEEPVTTCAGVTTATTTEGVVMIETSTAGALPAMVTQEDLAKAVELIVARLGELFQPTMKMIEDIKAQLDGAVSSEELEQMIGERLSKVEREKSYLHELFKGRREPNPGNLQNLFGDSGAGEEKDNG